MDETGLFSEHAPSAPSLERMGPMANPSIVAPIFADLDRHRQLVESITRSNPVLEAMESQRTRREQIRVSFARSPALEAFTAQGKPTAALLRAVGRSGALDAYTTKSSDIILKAIGGSGVFDTYAAKSSDRILKAAGRSRTFETFTGQNGMWLGQVQKTMGDSAFFASFGPHQLGRHRQLLAAVGKSPAIENAFRSWKVTLPVGMAEQMANFQSRILADVVIELPPFIDEEDSDQPWFGEESWSRLVFHMVAILKAAELMTAGMAGAKMELHAPVPSGVIYLLGIFIAAGELAAHFAEPAAKGRDERSEAS